MEKYVQVKLGWVGGKDLPEYLRERIYYITVTMVKWLFMYEYI